MLKLQQNNKISDRKKQKSVNLYKYFNVSKDLNGNIWYNDFSNSNPGRSGIVKISQGKGEVNYGKICNGTGCRNDKQPLYSF